MKKRMDQLLSGKFEYEESQLLFSSEKLLVSLKSGEKVRGEVYLGTENNLRIRGYITSSDRRLVPDTDEFSGTTICLSYTADARGLQPGDSVIGRLSFTTNIGEYTLPYEILVQRDQPKSSGKEVRSTREFAGIAERDFREAYRLFTDSSFASVLEQSTEKEKALYSGLSRQPVTYQHLEEFLVASGLKPPVRFSLKKSEAVHNEVKEDTQEYLEIQRSGWGHLRLEAEVRGDFLELPHPVILDEDFIGSSYRVPYVIHRDKLKERSCYGKIILRSPYEEKTVSIKASKGKSSSVHVNLEEKQHRVSLFRDYLAYKTGRMDFATWAASSHFLLNALSETGCDYPEYQMMHAYLLHLEQRDEEAIQILMQYQDKSYTKDDLEFAGVYLYICTLTGVLSDLEQAIARVENFYRQKEDSFFLLYALIHMKQEYRNHPAKAVYLLEELYERGCRSPLLYLEGWEFVKDNLEILHRMTPFWCQVFMFAGRRNLLTEEMAVRIAYLSGYEKHFRISLYRVLELCYQAFAHIDTLEAVCKYIMQGNPRQKEYFRWYSLAVEQGIRLTRLYEYYIETMDEHSSVKLPKPLLVYFSYNTNTLGDSRKALLYASIIRHKEEEPMVFASYREKMRKFAEAKVFEGKTGENYAVLYQEYFTVPDNSMDAELVADKMFTYRLYCDDKKIRQVVIRHAQMKKEEVYPLVHSVAYPRVYTKDAVILFQDDKQRRYVSTVDYSMQPLMDERIMMKPILRFGVSEPGLLLHYCEYTEISAENMDVFQRLVDADEIAEDYRNGIRRKVLRFYREHTEEEGLLHSLKKLDFRAYAAVDKKAMTELLVQHGLYTEAMQIVTEFGCEDVEETSLLRLVSRMITRREARKDAELLALASLVYSKGKYDEVILRYLMEYRFGTIRELLSIWKSAVGFDMDTYALEEKILGLLMLTGDFRKEGEEILQHYVKQAGKERVTGAYLTQVSYGCMVREYPISSFIRERLEYAYRHQWPVNRICQYALLKGLVKEKDPEDKYLGIKQDIFERCLKENLIFSMFRKLPDKLLGAHQLDDKTFVEYHASKDAKVTLFYALDNGLGTEGNYKSEPLHNQYEGIFVRTFTLFYGETLRYYFVTEEKGKIRKSAERTVTMNRTDSTSKSKYEMINRILAARKLEKDKEVALNLRQYLRQEEYVKYMFRLREEE